MDRVLCAANAQSMKYYFNEDDFSKLPQQVKDELKIMCVTYCADVGGVIVFSFNDTHRLHIQTIDPIDEIGAELKVKKVQADKAELFGQLEEFERKFLAE